jgi:hypothetical protein
MRVAKQQAPAVRTPEGLAEASRSSTKRGWSRVNHPSSILHLAKPTEEARLRLVRPGFPKGADDDCGRRLCRSSLTANQLTKFQRPGTPVFGLAGEAPGLTSRGRMSCRGNLPGWLLLKLLPWY